jgi:guanine deaminase
MTRRDFMREAVRISVQKMRANEGGPFGAVVVQDGRIVSRGWNRVTSTNDPTAHAEVIAIREACKKLGSFRLDDCELFTSCEPCPMCLSAIYWARLKAVYFANTKKDAARVGFDDAFLYREMSRPISQRKIPMKQLLRAAAIKAFEAWEKKADKVLY